MIKQELCEIPNHSNFYIDRFLNIHIFNDNKEIKIINRNELKFEYKKRIYYTFELANIVLYGVRDPQNFKNYQIISDELLISNWVIFKKIHFKLNGYYISNFGAVYSLHSKSLRKREVDEDGYIRISFSDTSMTHMAIHRLVYETYVGRIPGGLVVDHIDNCKWDNYYKNLQLLTSEENSRKAATEGLYAKSFRWTEDNVREICELMKSNISVKDIAAKFNIYPSDRILYKNFRNQLYNFRLHQRSWVDITSLYDFSKYDGNLSSRSKFRDSEIIEMRKLYDEGMNIKEIAKRFNTEPNESFRNIVRGLKRKKLYLKVI